ncbi:uncharacterized protein [Periplaneta americana]|uniref:uncharacterized protein isoform X2 n=1 Tax=Periplaneta americana TaxID=6978 RepID=UPI0037E838D9
MIHGALLVTLVALAVIVSARTMLLQEMVEHSVDEDDAAAAAALLQPDLEIGRPGCDVCTREEIDYCTGPKVLEDHCCCDMRYRESFPYVPHTCYLKPDCVPRAGDCDRYARLRFCCCDYYTGSKWKSQGTLLASSGKIFLLCLVGVLIAR